MSNLPTKQDFKKLYTVAGTFAKQLMFWEMSTPENREKYPPVFTLKLEEHEGLPSAYQVYMESIDEYDAASKLAPNMKVWDDLSTTNWFLNGVPSNGHQGLTVWREHMQKRDASLAKKQLIDQTKEGNTTAARALLAESKNKASAGRKSKKVTMESPTKSRILDFQKKMEGR